MRKYVYLTFDVFSICLMLIIALFLRNGAELIEEGNPGDLTTLLSLCLILSMLILPLFNTHNRLWRYTSSSDLGAIMIAVTLTVLLSNGGLFLFNRLDIVPRSVPPMHWALSVFALCGARLITRRFFGPGRTSAAKARGRQHVLLLGAGHVAELYLDFSKRIIPGQIIVEGVIDENPSLTKRSFHQHEILGTPDAIEQIIEDFHLHGILIKQIILTQPLDSLSLGSQQILLELERNHDIILVNFQKQIGVSERIMPAESSEDYEPFTERLQASYYPTSSYQPLKRSIDIIGSTTLMAVLSPFMIPAAIIVWFDVGAPLLFWQQRPGRYGKPFRLYKLRTMRHARRRLNEGRLAHKTGDINRTSAAGRWIRRLRLDELPQLFHILTGDMSFIGPRPLLPDDQPEGGEARLSIRPGITGWAQVHGGDALNAEQKLILDLWYIQNMSLWLDIKIIFKTIIVAATGDKPSLQRIDAYRRSLREPFTIQDPIQQTKHA